MKTQLQLKKASQHKGPVRISFITLIEMMVMIMMMRDDHDDDYNHDDNDCDDYGCDDDCDNFIYDFAD